MGASTIMVLRLAVEIHTLTSALATARAISSS